jgi:hypothetical protein
MGRRTAIGRVARKVCSDHPELFYTICDRPKLPQVKDRTSIGYPRRLSSHYLPLVGFPALSTPELFCIDRFGEIPETIDITGLSPLSFKPKSAIQLQSEWRITFLGGIEDFRALFGHYLRIFEQDCRCRDPDSPFV